MKGVTGHLGGSLVSIYYSGQVWRMRRCKKHLILQRYIQMDLDSFYIKISCNEHLVEKRGE